MIKISGNKNFNTEKYKEYVKIVGTDLPLDYLSFLQEYNGGRAESNVFDHNKYDFIGVTEFFGVGLKEESDLLKQKGIYLDRVPQEYLPIALAEGGNLICLAITKEKFGQIFFWDHENEADTGEKPWEENLIKIANSFKEFLNSLKKFDPKTIEIKKEQVKEVWIDPDFLKELKKK